MPKYDYQCPLCEEIMEVRHGIGLTLTSLPEGHPSEEALCREALLVELSRLRPDHPGWTFEELESELADLIAQAELGDEQATQILDQCVHQPLHKLVPSRDSLPLTNWREGASPTQINLRGGYKGKWQREMAHLHRARTVQGMSDAKFDPRRRYNGTDGLFRESEALNPRNRKAVDGREVRSSHVARRADR